MPNKTIIAGGKEKKDITTYSRKKFFDSMKPQTMKKKKPRDKIWDAKIYVSQGSQRNT